MRIQVSADIYCGWCTAENSLGSLISVKRDTGHLRFSCAMVCFCCHLLFLDRRLFSNYGPLKWVLEGKG